VKVLCEFSEGGSSFVRRGWGRVFKACGHDFRFWDPRRKSAFDAFHEFPPDVFIGTTYGVDSAVDKCVRARPGVRVALFASAWGDLTDGLDRERYPIVYVTDAEKRRLEKLKRETGRPDFVFIHVTQKYLEPTMGGWRSVGIEPVGILNAADTFEYLGGKFRQELACDVGFCGGYWGYKSRNLRTHILPLCPPTTPLRVKIFGNSPWPTACYLGAIDDSDVKDLFVSAAVCPNVSEPHSTDPGCGWDVIERVFKVPAAGGFLVSDHVDELREIFSEDEVPTESSPELFRGMVNHFVNNPGERAPFAEKARRKVLSGHTYFDRVAQMLGAFGMAEEASAVLRNKASFVPGC
jgi:hypothetical protein